MGTNHYAYGSNTYQGAMAHLTDSRTPDSCVSCHHYMADARLSGNAELGGHGFYLTSDVHGRSKDVIAVCTSCHTTGFSGYSPAFTDNPYTASADWDGDASQENVLDEIEGLRNLLIDYFGDSTNFGGGADAGVGPIVDAADGTDPDTGTNGYELYESWGFNTATFTEQQARAFWNFRLFIEDKSDGIHNPRYAAQILYDAADDLGLAVGALRP
jgi:hypothetical protein